MRFSKRRKRTHLRQSAFRDQQSVFQAQIPWAEEIPRHPKVNRAHNNNHRKGVDFLLVLILKTVYHRPKDYNLVVEVVRLPIVVLHRRDYLLV
jgi:hypothetical protein